MLLYQNLQAPRARRTLSQRSRKLMRPKYLMGLKKKFKISQKNQNIRVEVVQLSWDGLRT